MHRPAAGSYCLVDLVFVTSAVLTSIDSRELHLAYKECLSTNTLNTKPN